MGKAGVGQRTSKRTMRAQTSGARHATNYCANIPQNWTGQRPGTLPNFKEELLRWAKDRRRRAQGRSELFFVQPARNKRRRTPFLGLDQRLGLGQQLKANKQTTSAIKASVSCLFRFVLFDLHTVVHIHTGGFVRPLHTLSNTRSCGLLRAGFGFPIAPSTQL